MLILQHSEGTKTPGKCCGIYTFSKWTQPLKVTKKILSPLWRKHDSIFPSGSWFFGSRSVKAVRKMLRVTPDTLKTLVVRCRKRRKSDCCHQKRQSETKQTRRGTCCYYPAEFFQLEIPSWCASVPVLTTRRGLRPNVVSCSPGHRQYFTWDDGFVSRCRRTFWFSNWIVELNTPIGAQPTQAS